MKSLSEYLPDCEFGGKAASLSRLTREGYPVPKGYALAWNEELSDGSWYLLYTHKKRMFAVRSSAIGEDGSANSFAGMHESILNVDVLGIPSAIFKVRESGKSVRAQQYRIGRGMDPTVHMGVVIQEMVMPVVASAVVFTQDPIDGTDNIIIEWAPCLGEKIVSGQISPNNISLARKTLMKDLTNSTLQNASVRGVKLHLLTRACLSIEGAWGHPVDVEAAFDGTHWWICQARPITT